MRNLIRTRLVLLVPLVSVFLSILTIGICLTRNTAKSNSFYSSITRRIRNPSESKVSEALHFIREDIGDWWLMNLIGKNLTSTKTKKNIAKIKRALEENKTEMGYKLPLRIEDLDIDAGHGYNYRVAIFIGRDGKIEFSVYGDLDTDYSCWDRLKVIKGTVICLLIMCDCKITKIPPSPDYPAYGYRYYPVNNS